MVVVLNLSSRELDPKINYIPFQKMEINNTERKVNFLAETLQKEVTQGTEKQRLKKLKKLKKIYTKFVSILGATGAGMMVPLTTFARTENPFMTGNTPEITPPAVLEWGLTLALITVAIGVALSGSLLAIAGIYRMFRKRREAEEWTTDIIKGLVQVLISVPVVYALFYLAQLVFKNLPFLSGLM